VPSDAIFPATLRFLSRPPLRTATAFGEPGRSAPFGDPYRWSSSQAGLWSQPPVSGREHLLLIFARRPSSR